jgi:hypothetical protein
VRFGAAAGDGRDDADDGVFFYGRICLLEVADIVIADEDVYIGADISAFVEQVFFQVGKILCQFPDCAMDCAGADLQPGGIIGELPQGSGNDNCCHCIRAFLFLVIDDFW